MFEKTLANCKPSEFLAQTYKIKKAVYRWLKDTDVLAIRSRAPEGLRRPGKDASPEERAEALKANNEALRRQARENLSDMLDAVLEKHSQETLEVLALCCFVEPQDVDAHPVADYLTAFTELVENEAVLGFFTSLTRLGLTAGSKVYRG